MMNWFVDILKIAAAVMVIGPAILFMVSWGINLYFSRKEKYILKVSGSILAATGKALESAITNKGSE